MQITLPGIAFGGSASATPIPPATEAWTRWLRAVALGGQGFYAAAATELRGNAGVETAPVLRSLAASTRAAHLRQGGRHDRAAAHDGAALHLVAVEDTAREDVVAAWCDALTGLAADNLGRGMFSATERLLGRVERMLGDRETPGARTGDTTEAVTEWIWGSRLDLRWRWVNSELAMYTGDPVAAIEHAAAARVIAVAGPSLRHGLKTELIGAAAAAAGGDLTTAGEDAQRVAQAAAAAAQLPLQWAAAKLLEGIGAGASWGGEAQRLGSVLAGRGGAMGQRAPRDGGGWLS